MDLKNPDHILGVELGEEHAHLWIQKHKAAGGLPVGVSGRAMLMLSGGIDSPVAGYLAQKKEAAPSMRSIFIPRHLFRKPVEKRSKNSDFHWLSDKAA